MRRLDIWRGFSNMEKDIRDADIPEDPKASLLLDVKQLREWYAAKELKLETALGKLEHHANDRITGISQALERVESLSAQQVRAEREIYQNVEVTT